MCVTFLYHYDKLMVGGGSKRENEGMRKGEIEKGRERERKEKE